MPISESILHHLSCCTAHSFCSPCLLQGGMSPVPFCGGRQLQSAKRHLSLRLLVVPRMVSALLDWMGASRVSLACICMTSGLHIVLGDGGVSRDSLIGWKASGLSAVWSRIAMVAEGMREEVNGDRQGFLWGA